MADRIVKCAAALAGASYHDGPPSAELRDVWREMAADARQEVDELRAEVERLRSPAVVLAEAERLLRATPLFAVCFDDMFVGADWWTEKDGEDAMDCKQFDTLAEAYERLTGGEHGQ